ncbi:MAG: hypothetical protein HRU32_16610, partial [Rhodobacteraceae bacterium]|nr:hypothetical protein [Paracoccaceae bacterium]
SPAPNVHHWSLAVLLVVTGVPMAVALRFALRRQREARQDRIAADQFVPTSDGLIFQTSKGRLTYRWSDWAEVMSDAAFIDANGRGGEKPSALLLFKDPARSASFMERFRVRAAVWRTVSEPLEFGRFILIPLFYHQEADARAAVSASTESFCRSR